MLLSSLGRSKLARRFAILFFACALIPSTVLIFLSYQRIRTEMIDQSMTRLISDTKSYGRSLMDRMVRMRDYLIFLGRIIEEEGLGVNGKLSENITEETRELFDGLALLEKDGTVHVIYGEPAFVDPTLLLKEHLTGTQSGAVRAVASADGSHQVSMIYPLRLPTDEQALIVGKANTPHLWGVGPSPLIPAFTELGVYNPDGKAVFSTADSPGDSIAPYKADNSQTMFRRFEYNHGGQTYLAGAWDLFLASKFDSQTWTIVLSQPEDYILATLDAFQRNLTLVVILGLMIVLLLSVHFIRRRLEPLDELKKRTEQIAVKDFTSEVQVDSGDEFEELADSFNLMSRELQKQFNALETIDHIDRAILSTLSLTDIINTALPMIRNFFQCELIVLGTMADTTTSYLRGSLLRADMTEPEAEYFSMDSSFQDMLFDSATPIAWENEQIRGENVSNLDLDDFATVISVPLKKEGMNKGILIICHKEERQYDNSELNQVRQLADQVSIAMSNAELVDNLEKLAVGSIEALARAVDAKSKWTAGHSERVAKYAVILGQAMDLEEHDIELLHRGGLLHDIGKIGTPIDILDKKDKLTDEEFEEVKSHPEIGAKILEPVEVHQDILPIVLEHHERFDGRGYPHGMAGSEITLLGRITAVADVYDALSSARPYRDGWFKERVVEHIIEGSGTHFDPAIIDAFKTIVDEIPELPRPELTVEIA
jgi:putative nucleotidyltransferase with HDIG domain